MRANLRLLALAAAAVAVLPAEVLAQGTSPWVDAVANLSTAFTGPIARGLALVSIVVGGLMFAFGRAAVSPRWPGSSSAWGWRSARRTSLPGCSKGWRYTAPRSGTATRF